MRGFWRLQQQLFPDARGVSRTLRCIPRRRSMKYADNSYGNSCVKRKQTFRKRRHSGCCWGGAGILLACFVCQRQTPGEIVCDAQESGSDVHQHKQALKDLEAKLVVRSPIGFLFDGPVSPCCCI